MKKRQQKQQQKIPKFQDVPVIKHRIELETPNPGDYLYDYKLQQALKDKNTYDDDTFSKKFKIDFFDLPISTASKKCLKQRKFIKMTEIQRCVLPHALAGSQIQIIIVGDILGASKTGSGKTLSYLLPLIETLYRNLWTPLDGLGAIVILPTRELAMQVFEVFNSISEEHILAVGLLIGGKNVEYEKQRIQGMNVLICTPGRLLQHMEETPGFDAGNLQVLVIDEADTVLEMGFWEALQTILKYIPQERQTMLFSATLTKDIHQLTKLSLRKPEMVLLHSVNKQQEGGIENMFETPQTLKQHYMVVKPDDKLDVLFSFIKTHLRDKILVFFASCKQVRFVYETFKRLKMGTPLFELHGRQKQNKRMAIYFTFVEHKFSCLFTTNIAARGLDFPKIDWVVQYDCPEDVQTYIHRVGRTARYKAGGASLSLFNESEVSLVEKLSKKNIVIKQIHLNPSKQLTIRNTVQSFVTEDKDLKYLAQRAFVTYMRSVYLTNDKDNFEYIKEHANDLAESYGLVQIPVIKFKKNDKIESEPEAEEQEYKPVKKNKLQKLKEKIDLKKQQKFKNNLENITDVKHLKNIARENDDGKFEKMREIKIKNQDQELTGGLFINKGKHLPSELDERTQLISSKRQLKKIKPDGFFGGRNIVMFQEDGTRMTVEESRIRQIKKQQQEVLDQDLDFRGDLYGKLDEHAEEDRLNELSRRKNKRQKKKQQIKKAQEDFTNSEGEMIDNEEEVQSE